MSPDEDFTLEMWMPAPSASGALKSKGGPWPGVTAPLLTGSGGAPAPPMRLFVLEKPSKPGGLAAWNVETPAQWKAFLQAQLEGTGTDVEDVELLEQGETGLLLGVRSSSGTSCGLSDALALRFPGLFFEVSYMEYRPRVKSLYYAAVRRPVAVVVTADD